MFQFLFQIEVQIVQSNCHIKDPNERSCMFPRVMVMLRFVLGKGNIPQSVAVSKDGLLFHCVAIPSGVLRKVRIVCHQRIFFCSSPMSIVSSVYAVLPER